MGKLELERSVLRRATPLLRNRYGNFLIDENQTDRPDAAIDVVRSKNSFSELRRLFKVGIEITTVDKEDDIGYMADNKFGRSEENSYVSDVLSGQSENIRPIKINYIDIDSYYIFNGAKRKVDKYSSYAQGDRFREVVLLCYSEHLQTSRSDWRNLQEWTNFYLSREQYPYDAVLFVGLTHGDPVEVYDKRKPRLEQPFTAFKTYRVGHMNAFLPTETRHNLAEIAGREPVIKKRRKK